MGQTGTVAGIMVLVSVQAPVCHSTNLYKKIEAFIFSTWLILNTSTHGDQVKTACKDYCEDIDLRQLSAELPLWALKWTTTAKKQSSDIEFEVPR